MTVPRFTRLAEQLTGSLRRDLGIKTVLLSTIDDVGEPEIHFAIMECLDERGITSHIWACVDDIGEFLPSQESLLVKKSLELTTNNLPADRFSQLGWIAQLLEWARSHSGEEVTDFAHVSGMGAFALVKFLGTSKALWFKAVGEPNLREFTITLALSQLCPEFIPRLLASDSEVSGWLMEDAGEPLSDNHPDYWAAAAESVSTLQIKSILHVPLLINEGCRDLRICSLRENIDRFFTAMTSIMEKQPAVPPPRLTAAELSTIASSIRDACDQLEGEGIPDTLGHLDFNPGNILFHDKRCRFTDWAEAYIGPPFFTLEYLLVHLAKLEDVSAVCNVQHIRSIYERSWRALYPDANIDRAAAVSPLLAVYAYALSLDDWKRPDTVADGRYLRSLTRRMKQEADLLRARRNT